MTSKKTALEKIKNKRKHHLLKNEINMLQMILQGRCYPIEEYRVKLVERLEDLKREWYK